MSARVEFGTPKPNKVIVATCNLNQWALDFDGNLARTEESIRIAKDRGARFRVGPELELCGYSCEDHFREMDTYLHSNQSLAALLKTDATDDILCDIGCPVMHDGVRYNCRIFCLNRRILLIRPKTFMANDGNYHETRFFASWKGGIGDLSSHILDDELREATGQDRVPFGVGILQTQETKIAAEICEELWVSHSPHIDLTLCGVEIFSNGSGSHHQLRKLDARLQLIMSATAKCGGCYVFSNHKGCDGTRLYFDGSSLICVNGQIKAQSSQFSLCDVEVATAVVDLNDIRSYRSNIASLQDQASLKQHANLTNNLKNITIDVTSFSMRAGGPSSFELSSTNDAKEESYHSNTMFKTTESIQPYLHSPEEECVLGPACWLWDYLRRSNAVGFFLPLSGGADSASVATIVRVMCELVVRAACSGDKTVLSDLLRIAPPVRSDILALQDSYQDAILLTRDAQRLRPNGSDGGFIPFAPHKKAADKLCNLILHTTYMGTENSSQETKDRALQLATHFGAYHSSIAIDDIVSAVLKVFSIMSGGFIPKFTINGGDKTQDLALQNIQARIRMVMSYLFAQLLPWIRKVQNNPIANGFLLVLGAGNVDEALRGYLTKYDCSSADLNPIGGICKNDIKKLLLWGENVLRCSTLGDIVNAPPTAELRPLQSVEPTSTSSADISTYNDNNLPSRLVQTDEEDMGMTYAELGVFGVLRKVKQCGPLSMYYKLLDIWGAAGTLVRPLLPDEIAMKVKKFFLYYSINRHKMTTLTPSYHAENYSPDDNRFDFRPFLYNTSWNRQFNNIDAAVLMSRESHILTDHANESGDRL